MSLQTWNRTNFSEKRTVRKSPEDAVSVQVDKESLFGQQFVTSFRNLYTEYCDQKTRKLEPQGNLRNFQWEFWIRKVSQILHQNEKVLNLVNNPAANFSPSAKKKCEQTFTRCYLTYMMVNQSVWADLHENSAKRSLMTILISLDALQKLRCRKYLKECKGMSPKNQQAITESTRRQRTLTESPGSRQAILGSTRSQRTFTESPKSRQAVPGSATHRTVTETPRRQQNITNNPRRTIFQRSRNLLDNLNTPEPQSD